MRSVLTILLLAVLVTPGTFAPALGSPAEFNEKMTQSDSHCATSAPPTGEYTLTICITLQDDGPTVTQLVPVMATLDVSGTNPGIRTVTFYLDGEYLITDYEVPYTFNIPSDHFVDGSHQLSVAVLMRDTFVSDQAALELTFANGTDTLPINTNTFTPAAGRPYEPPEPYIVAVVGDGAGGQIEAQQVVELISSWNPNLFLYLGDVYGNGTYTEFLNWYGDETHLFGRFRAITNPIVGDHEYEGRTAPGYYFYWDNIPDYYSFDAAGWHFISLNSTTQFGQRAPGSPQFEWLLQDLNSSESQCTIAYLHQPIFSIGLHGGDERLMDIWAVLAQHGVEVTISGNDHDYQRWQAMDDGGNPDPNGTTPFVVGTGGQGIRNDPGTDSRLAKGYDASSDVVVFGALNFILNPKGLEYRFINIEGDVLDSGVIGCETAAADTASPSTPSDVSNIIDATGRVTLSWTQSTDDTGVTGYTIYRNGTELIRLDAATTHFTDTTAKLGESYYYTVTAFDLAHNVSPPSELVTATTVSEVTLKLSPVADAFVDESDPNVNFGSSRTLRTDNMPAVQVYLLFDIPSLPGEIISATLRVFANSPSTTGYEVFEVSSSNWDESEITYNDAPQITNLIGSSTPFESDTWASADVTSAIVDAGPITLTLLTAGPTNTRYSSREGANPPELIIKVGGA